MPFKVCDSKTHETHITLELQEWHSVTHHLRVAAGRYTEDAESMRKVNQPQLVKSFEDQATAARKLADEIDELV